MEAQEKRRGNPALKEGEYLTDPKTGQKKLAAAVALGSIRTEKKSRTSAENGKRNTKPGPGQPPAPLSSIECVVKVGKTPGACPGGDSPTGHHWSCPRGQAIIRRQKQGRDVVTGEKLAQVPA